MADLLLLVLVQLVSQDLAVLLSLYLLLLVLVLRQCCVACMHAGRSRVCIGTSNLPQPRQRHAIVP